MRSTLLLVSLLFPGFVSGYMYNITTEGTFETDRYMDSYVIVAKDKIGPKMCVTDCMRLSSCNAVNYTPGKLKCEFLQASFSVDSLRTKAGTFYTAIDQWNRTTGPCYPNPCKQNNERTECIEAVNDHHICITFDTPCDSSPCQNSGTCGNDVGKYNCVCMPGYYGAECQYTPCTPINCQHSGTCIITGPDGTCNCQAGYYGDYCQYTPCTDVICQNSGTCVITGSTWECSCQAGFYGTNCQYTPCTGVTCQNSGSCTISGSSFDCNCPAGYSGTYCQRDPCYGNNCGEQCRVKGSSYECCSTSWGRTTCS